VSGKRQDPDCRDHHGVRTLGGPGRGRDPPPGPLGRRTRIRLPSSRRGAIVYPAHPAYSGALRGRLGAYPAISGRRSMAPQVAQALGEGLLQALPASAGVPQMARARTCRAPVVPRVTAASTTSTPPSSRGVGGRPAACSLPPVRPGPAPLGGRGAARRRGGRWQRPGRPRSVTLPGPGWRGPPARGAGQDHFGVEEEVGRHAEPPPAPPPRPSPRLEPRRSAPCPRGSARCPGSQRPGGRGRSLRSCAGPAGDCRCPTRAPFGEVLEAGPPTRQSRGSARCGMAAMVSPGVGSVRKVPSGSGTATSMAAVEEGLLDLLDERRRSPSATEPF